MQLQISPEACLSRPGELLIICKTLLNLSSSVAKLLASPDTVSSSLFAALKLKRAALFEVKVYSWNSQFKCKFGNS